MSGELEQKHSLSRAAEKGGLGLVIVSAGGWGSLTFKKLLCCQLYQGAQGLSLPSWEQVFLLPIIRLKPPREGFFAQPRLLPGLNVLCLFCPPAMTLLPQKLCIWKSDFPLVVAARGLSNL